MTRKLPPVTRPGPGVIHCQPCDDDPKSRWRAAVVYLTFPPEPGFPEGRWASAHVCDLCLWDSVNASIRTGSPLTITPLETTP